MNEPQKEQLAVLYNIIKREIVKDTLKLMNDTSKEYITIEGQAFLDGLQVNGEQIEIINKKEYDLLKIKYEDVLQRNSELTKQIKKKDRKLKIIHIFKK
jgi:hypothetical protein